MTAFRVRDGVGTALAYALAGTVVVVTWHAHVSLDGSVAALWHAATSGDLGLRVEALGSLPGAGLALAAFAGLQALLLRVLPPTQRWRGVGALALSLGITAAALGIGGPSLVYDHLGALLVCAAVGGPLLLAGVLVTRGSRGAASSRRRFVTLCSRVGRCGLAAVGLGLAAEQAARGALSVSMIVCVGLQWLWIGLWLSDERRRLDAIDLESWTAAVTLGGWYLVWLPGGYGSTALYLVHHPVDLGWGLALGLGGLGVLCLAGAIEATAQLRRLRDGADDIVVWGRRAEVIGEGPAALLASGWWSVARHFGFVLQWMVVLCWSLTALFGHALPYLAVACLALVQVVRAFSIDARRADKHGEAWLEYCRRVPYRLLPGVL